MREENPVAEYKMSNGMLAQLGDKAVIVVTRDLADLASYGVDAATITDIEDKTDVVKNFPSDQELEGNITDLTEIKDQNADDLKVDMREMMSRVGGVFAPTSGKYHSFGTKGMNEMKDPDLIKCGYRVCRRATHYLPLLGVKGVTAPMIAALLAQTKKFDDSFDDQQDAIFARRSQTHDRIIASNDLYASIVEVFGYGKNYYVSRNSAKYKDYVIYNTPSGKPDLSGIVVTVRGNMLDSMTGEPVLEGKVILEYVDAPIIVEANGKWEAPEVPIESTQMWGTALAHMTYYKVITLSADDNNNFDIKIEPGADNPPPPSV